MTVKEFVSELMLSLLERGVSKEDATANVITLVKTLTEDDLHEITEYKTVSDFKLLSDSLADFILNKDDESIKKETDTAEPDYEYDAEESLYKEYMTESLPAYDMLKTGQFVSGAKIQKDAASDKTKTFDVQNNPNETKTFDIKNRKTEKNTDSDLTKTVTDIKNSGDGKIILGDESTVKEKTVLTPRGKAIFITIALLTSPITVCAAVILGALFATSVCTVCLFIAVVFALVLAQVAVGGSGFLVGIIYGAVKIFAGLSGTGLYEMGIGTACLGVTFILSFATYNFGSKTMPYALKELLLFWGFAVRRIGSLLEHFREECNRL